MTQEKIADSHQSASNFHWEQVYFAKTEMPFQQRLIHIRGFIRHLSIYEEMSHALIASVAAPTEVMAAPAESSLAEVIQMPSKAELVAQAA